MNTTYYITYEIKRANGSKVWYESKHYDNPDVPQAMFQEKVKDPRTLEAHLVKCETWTDPNEIPFETTTNRTREGWRRTNTISSYNPKYWGGVKIWDLEDREGE